AKNDIAVYPNRICTPSIGYHHRFRLPLTLGTTEKSSRPPFEEIGPSNAAAASTESPSEYLVRYLFTPSSRAAVRTRLSENWLARKISLSLRSEEHTSELQSQSNLVCRLLLEKKKKKKKKRYRKTKKKKYTSSIDQIASVV